MTIQTNSIIKTALGPVPKASNPPSKQTPATRSHFDKSDNRRPADTGVDLRPSPVGNAIGDKKTTWGRVSYRTHIGYKPKKKHNEDAVAINARGNIFGVMDGLGGMENSHIAARALAKSIEEASPEAKIEDITQRASRHIQNTEHARKAATCAIIGKINNGQLEIYSSGDCKCIVLNNDNEVVFDSEYYEIPSNVDKKHAQERFHHYCNEARAGALTVTQLEHLMKVKWLTDENKNNLYRLFHENRHGVLECIDRNNSGVDSLGHIPLHRGYRIMMMSDGIGDNLTTSELKKMNDPKNSPETIRKKIFDKALERQKQVDEVAKKIQTIVNFQTIVKSLRNASLLGAALESSRLGLKYLHDQPITFANKAVTAVLGTLGLLGLAGLNALYKKADHIASTPPNPEFLQMPKSDNLSLMVYDVEAS